VEPRAAGGAIPLQTRVYATSIDVNTHEHGLYDGTVVLILAVVGFFLWRNVIRPAAPPLPSASGMPNAETVRTQARETLQAHGTRLKELEGQVPLAEQEASTRLRLPSTTPAMF
jgi:hypothetical protein